MPPRRSRAGARARTSARRAAPRRTARRPPPARRAARSARGSAPRSTVYGSTVRSEATRAREGDDTHRRRLLPAAIQATVSGSIDAFSVASGTSTSTGMPRSRHACSDARNSLRTAAGSASGCSLPHDLLDVAHEGQRDHVHERRHALERGRSHSAPARPSPARRETGRRARFPGPGRRVS